MYEIKDQLLSISTTSINALDQKSIIHQSRNLTNFSVFRDRSRPVPPLKDSLCQFRLWTFFLFVFIAYFSSGISVIFLSIGADYFEDSPDNGDGCHSGNAGYALFYSVFSSIGGGLAFIFNAYIGRLSDAYGRKKLMIFQCLMQNSSIIGYAITQNIWVYLALLPLGSVIGAIPFEATIADLVYPAHRTVIYALLLGIIAIAVIISSVLLLFMTNIFSDKIYIIYIAVISSIISFIILLRFVKETLIVDLRTPMEAHWSANNPFKYFSKLTTNDIILWFSLMALFIAIPGRGMGFVTNYVLAELKLCDSSSAETFLAYGQMVSGLSMLVVVLFVLPVLNIYLRDIPMIFVGVCLEMAHIAVGILIYYFPQYGTGLSINFFRAAASSMLFPAIQGAYSKRLSDRDQGIGLGVFGSMTAVATFISPLPFAFLYDAFRDKGLLVTMPLMILAVFMVFGLIILFVPLRRVINKYEYKLENMRGK